MKKKFKTKKKRKIRKRTHHLLVSFDGKKEYNGYRLLKIEVEILNFLNINDTKLKVILSAEECVNYGIDTTKSEFSRTEIKQVVRDILTLSGDECGFSVTNEKILVQLYPMPSGECEIFVTKLTGLTSRDRGMLNSVDGLTTMEKRRGIYRFDSRENLIRAANAIYREGVECELYSDESGRYYISIDEEITDGISQVVALIEFAQRISDLPIQVLSEYGKLILSDNTLKEIISDNF